MANVPATATPPNMCKQVMLDIGNKAVEQLGKHRLWLIPYRMRRLPNTLSAEAFREVLRGLGIFIADDSFALLVRTYGGGGGGTAPATAEEPFDLDRFLRDFPSCVLSPRRRHVVDLVVKKLDPNGTGLIEADRLLDCYDVQRHPAVVGGTRDADDITAEFLDTFHIDGSSDDDDVAMTCEELVYYYCGLSLCTAKDEELELRCIRAFSLDRPKLDTADEAARLAGSRAVSRQSRLLGEGRAHPLYTTTSGEYGSTAKDNPPAPPTHGRSQKFTRNQPPRTGGATSMNM